MPNTTGGQALAVIEPVSPPPLAIGYSRGDFTSATTRTVSDVTPVSVGGSGADTIALSVSEDAYLGDAQFTVSVDGVQIGGVETATALYSAGQSQIFTLQGDFGAWPHVVTVRFLNDAVGVYTDGSLAGDRNLYVNAITADGVTTVENSYQNLQGSVDYGVTLGATSAGTTPSAPSAPIVPGVAITAQILADDSGTSGTDNITNNGNVVLAGTVTGASGTVVTILDGNTTLGTATITGGSWNFAATLGDGTHNLQAVATDSAGNTATSDAAPAITVDTANPVITIAVPVQISGGTLYTLSGMVADATATSVQITDNGSLLGNATVSNGGWSFATALGAGSQALAAIATDLAGNTASAASTIAVAAPTLAIVYSCGVFTSASTRSVSDTTAASIGGSGNDTIALNISEDAYLGDAQFTVSVDGVQIGGVQTATALHSAGQSQNFTVQGNFGAGAHVVTVSFLNDAVGVYVGGSLAGDRNLYVNAITADGVTIVENSDQNLQGAVNYNVALPATSSSPAPGLPGVVITAQTLADDTGASNSDNVTGDGDVSLSGTVTGASGTVVTILDGNATIGVASITDGNWIFVTSLSAGAHSLHAVATDPAANIAVSVAAPAIIVDTADPVITIAAPAQVSGSTAYIISGTVADSTATSVQLSDNGIFLGNATVSNGSWSFATGALATGSQSLAAIATDLAGNTASVSTTLNVAAAVTVSTPPSVVSTVQDVVLATVSTGSGTTQQQVTLSSASAIDGTFVPVSTLGIGSNALVLYNWNPATQLQGFLAAQAGGTASVVGIGDSWSDGFGSAANGWTQLSYLNEMTQVLNQEGVAAQSANFLGSQFYITNGLVDDNRVTPVGYANPNSFYDGGWAIVAGGNAIYLNGVGKGFNFQLDTAGNYDEVTLSYIDVGSGAVSLSVDGVPLGSMRFGNTGQTLTQTIKIPAGMHSDLVVQSTGNNPVYIQGASFGSTTNPAIQVYNAAIGGWDSTGADTSILNGQVLLGSGNGFGQTAGAAALAPSLAIVDLGINDIAGGEDTVTQTLANIEQIVATLRAAGTDVIVMIPAPFGSASYATALPELRAGLEAFSQASNVPLIDLSSTYGNDVTGLLNAGLMSDQLHGDATLYADIGSQIATLLAQTIAAGTSASVSNSTNTINVGSGAQTMVLTSAGETVNATASGTAIIQGTAAQAGALINGNGSTVLEITDSGGTAVLNAGDTGLTVKLDSATNLTLNAMQFISADGTAGGSTITAGAINQTLLGGRGDTLVGAAAYGDLFKGTAVLLKNVIIGNFGGSDQIDVTNISSSKVTGLSWTANSAGTGGTLTLSEGTRKTSVLLQGNYASGSFGFKSDGAGGTLIGLG